MRQSRKPSIEGRQSGAFLPDFCSIRVVFGVVITAELLAVIFTLAAVRNLGEFLQKLSIISLLVQWIALSTAALLCLMRAWVKRQSDRVAALLAWGLLQLLTLLVCIATIWLSEELIPVLAWEADQGLLFRALGISMIVGGLVLHYLHLQSSLAAAAGGGK